jgi:hypothetical protein
MVDHIIHIGHWDPATTAVGFGTIITMVILKKIPVTEKAAAVITLFLGTVGVNLLRLPSVELVSNIAKIPAGGIRSDQISLLNINEIAANQGVV